MKEFSLEEYLKNPDREVVTRDGERVRILCTDRPDDNFPIVALVIDEDGFSSVYSFFNNGRYIKDEPSGIDLMFAPVKHEAWINLYRDCCAGVNYPGCRTFSTEKEAKQGLTLNDDRHVATIKIEWEEE